MLLLLIVCISNEIDVSARLNLRNDESLFFGGCFIFYIFNKIYLFE